MTETPDIHEFAEELSGRFGIDAVATEDGTAVEMQASESAVRDAQDELADEGYATEVEVLEGELIDGSSPARLRVEVAPTVEIDAHHAEVLLEATGRYRNEMLRLPPRDGEQSEEVRDLDAACTAVAVQLDDTLPVDHDPKRVSRLVNNTYREFKDQMSDGGIEELLARLQDERNRRSVRRRRADSNGGESA